jgi:flotillin
MPSKYFFKVPKMKEEEKLELVGTGLIVLSLFGAVFSRYKVAKPSQYLVRTGLGIDGLSITKKGVHWPGQRVSYIEMSPTTFSVNVPAMSKERIPFLMPSVWTIGPKDNKDALKTYASLLSDKGISGLENTVVGVIQGETRVLTANLSLDELFSNREQFRNNVEEKINNIINDMGLRVYNANVAELSDLDDKNRYFEEQKLRALEKVNQDARVAVASAAKDGTIGEKAETVESRKQVSELERDATIAENTNARGIAESKTLLDIAKAQFNQNLKIALAESEAQAELRRLALQKEVEEQRNLQLTAQLRANLFTSAAIDAEVKIKQAEANADVKIKQAEANSTSVIIEANANLQAKLKEAEGIKALRKAEAEGLLALVSAVDGNTDGLVKVLLTQKDMFPKLIEEQAKGLQGLNPKINIWNTGSGPGSNNGINSTLQDFFKTGIPLLDQIRDQTGKDILGSLGIKDMINNTVLHDKH